jgi:hypothetical protein
MAARERCVDVAAEQVGVTDREDRRGQVLGGFGAWLG